LHHWRARAGRRPRPSTVTSPTRRPAKASRTNLAAGDVEVEAEGTPESVERLRELLRRGPPLARVHEVRELPPGMEALPARFAASPGDAN